MSGGAHLLSGAGSGIGEALARRLLERGDEVWAVVRSEGRADELGQAMPGVHTVVADLAEPASVEQLAPSLPASLSSVVHAAGVVDLGAVADLSVAAWQEQLAVNLIAPAALTRVALPALRSAGGTVVFVNSGAGIAAHPTWAAYAASKHGLRALADSLRGEEPDLRVTTVYPGRTATPMQEKVHAQEGKAVRRRRLDPGLHGRRPHPHRARPARGRRRPRPAREPRRPLSSQLSHQTSGAGAALLDVRGGVQSLLCQFRAPTSTIRSWVRVSSTRRFSSAGLSAPVSSTVVATRAVT